MINKFIKIIIISFLVIVSINGQETKEDFYEQISSAVIRLEHFDQIIDVATQQPIEVNKPNGTAFFVAWNRNLYVVSARHVVDKNYDLRSRVRCRNTLTNVIEVIELKLPKDGWIFHESGGDSNTHYVDIAVQKIKWINNRTIKYFHFKSKDSEDSTGYQLPFKDCTPPSPILSFGFPAIIGFDLVEQRPLGRSGIVSMVVGKKFIKIDSVKYAEERSIILDIDMFGGNSGSPVINRMDILNPKPKLFGLIFATNKEYRFAIMEPTSRIIETLDIAKDHIIENFDFWNVIN